ncbi:hypothetical protein DSUL_20385 [Desulfovibrionales bacterium]
MWQLIDIITKIIKWTEVNDHSLSSLFSILYKSKPAFVN